tara:strand:+ start:1756 stop:2121 length:366 start_codon:yes stop_codon:yes gene_type:complete
MSFDGKNPFKIMRQTWRPGDYEVETLSGARTLTHQDAQFIKLDAGGGDKTVILPNPRAGSWFWIFNGSDAAEDLNVKQANGTTALLSIEQNESAIVFCERDREDAGSVGWSLFAVIAIAIS